MNGVLTLWVVRASSGQPYSPTQQPDQYCAVYALDEAHARERVKNWLELHPHLPEHHFTPYPDGYLAGHRKLPGKITVAQWEALHKGRQERE